MLRIWAHKARELPASEGAIRDARSRERIWPFFAPLASLREADFFGLGLDLRPRHLIPDGRRSGTPPGGLEDCARSGSRAGPRNPRDARRRGRAWSTRSLAPRQGGGSRGVEAGLVRHGRRIGRGRSLSSCSETNPYYNCHSWERTSGVTRGGRERYEAHGSRRRALLARGFRYAG